MTLWLDATDPTGDGLTQPTNNSNITTWQDKSSKKFHMTQTASTSQPKFIINAFNNKPVIRFDGVNDFLSHATINLPDLITTNAYTIYIVFKINNVSSTNNSELRKNDSILGDGIGRIGLALRKVGGTEVEAHHFNWDGNEDTAKKTLTSGTATMLTLIHNPSGNIIISKNSDTGAIALSEDTLSFTGLFIGKNTYNNYYDGDIAEILIYNHQLTTDELATIDNYLAAKWGITLE